MNKQEEYNEFNILEGVIESILEQTKDLNEMFSTYDAEGLLDYFSKVRTVYSYPLSIYIAREVDKDYWNKESTIISSIEEILTEEIRNILGGYKIKFVNIRNMTFGIYGDDDVELVRFSLMDKNYMFMKWSVITEEGYVQAKSRSKKNIKEYETLILADEENIKKYQSYLDNYLLFFKDIRRFEDLYNIVFKFKRITKNIKSLILTKKLKIKSSREIIEKEKEGMKLTGVKKLKSRAIITDINLFFSHYGYKREDEDYSGFYF